MNKIKSWIARHKFLTALILVLGIPFILIYKPYKATNPNNPLFAESQFQLSDYNFRFAALRHALQVLLPVGTDKKYVNLMLVDRGKAEKIDMKQYSREKNWFVYRYNNLTLIPSPDAWRIDVYYDEQDKLKILMLNRGLINGVWIDKEHEFTSDKKKESTHQK